MAKASLEELRGRIAAGEYAVDAGGVAGDILVKFALVRDVRRALMQEEREAGGGKPERRGWRRRLAPSRPLLPRVNGLGKPDPE